MNKPEYPPCPGCGKTEAQCPAYGDECWRNNGCPASPPDRVPIRLADRTRTRAVGQSGGGQ